MVVDKKSHEIPLFRDYPLLCEKLPYTSLGLLPTPVEKLRRFGEEIGVSNLHIKRDDLSGEEYGGNKVRKLEFLLGQALKNNAREVLTFGFAGSNHALATAIYARTTGMKSISMLLPQPNAHYVRRNLLASYHYGAELHQYRDIPIVATGTMYQLLRHKLKHGRFPIVIPAGGSSPLGAVGFVNAAFELREQIEQGQIPEPDYIYVALGSTGTAAGLMLGIKAANIRSHVICVPVAGEKFVNARRALRLHNRTSRYLHSLDRSFPQYELTEKDMYIRHGYFGKGYAHFTEQGMAAVGLIKRTEGIELEGTYTGKTLACLIDDARYDNLKDKVVIFWNTHNSRDYSSSISNVDYHNLPKCFHRYFQEDVQPLDKEV